jgi:tripartite-type tricarboxylate transporter receptor subunit TctC
VPDVPTVIEAGYPDLALDGLVGFFGPPTMPERVRESIAADVREAIDPAVEERLNLTGQIPNFGGPADFAADIAQQSTRIGGAAKDLGIVPTQ